MLRIKIDIENIENEVKDSQKTILATAIEDIFNTNFAVCFAQSIATKIPELIEICGKERVNI